MSGNWCLTTQLYYYINCLWQSKLNQTFPSHCHYFTHKIPLDVCKFVLVMNLSKTSSCRDNSGANVHLMLNINQSILFVTCTHHEYSWTTSHLTLNNNQSIGCFVNLYS